MKMKSQFASLLAVLLASAPLLSAGEVERLRTLVAEQEMQIQQLELKIAKLTNTPAPDSTTETPVSEPLTTAASSKTPSDDNVIPKAENCAEPAASEPPKTYTIQPGDNMVSIARKHGTTSAILNELNGLKKDSIIRSGQKLKLPAATTIAATETVKTSSPVAEPKPVPAPEPTVTLSETTSSTVKHTVASNETFYSIAKTYNVTINALIIKNPSINPAALRVGQVVEIPGKPKTTDEAAVPTTQESLTLSSQSNIPVSSQSSTSSQRRGADKPVKITKEITYSDFAKKYNTTPARLDQLNGLRLDPTTILAQGSELYIPEQQP